MAHAKDYYIKSKNLRLLFPLINPIVCHNTDLCFKIQNLNLQVRSGLETERSNDKMTESLLDSDFQPATRTSDVTM